MEKRKHLEKQSEILVAKEEYEKLIDFFPSFLYYVETFKKTFIILTKALKKKTFRKDSTMEQELVNCHAVHDVATEKKRRMCVTITKYSLNKPHYVQTRLFSTKENKVLKQVACVNYTLNEFKELAQVLGDFMFVKNCNVQ